MSPKAEYWFDLGAEKHQYGKNNYRRPSCEKNNSSIMFYELPLLIYDGKALFEKLDIDLQKAWYQHPVFANILAYKNSPAC
jgi:hypothetical protein